MRGGALTWGEGGRRGGDGRQRPGFESVHRPTVTEPDGEFKTGRTSNENTDVDKTVGTSLFMTRN